MGDVGALIWLVIAFGAASVVLAAALFRFRAREQKDAQERAAAAATIERRLAAVLATGRDGVVVHSTAGQVLLVNEAAARAFDAGAAHMTGRPVVELPVRWVTEHGDDVQPSAVFARSAPGRLDAGPSVVGALPQTGAPVRWVQVTTRGVPTADGGMEMLTILTDVTAPREMQAALARSETQFRLAMENAPIGMALADAQWRLREVNAAFAALFAVDPTALVGKDLSALSHPDDRANERAQVQRVLAGESDRFTLEKRYLRHDGQTVWAVLDVALVRSPDGAPYHFVVQLRDVTSARMQSEILAHRADHDPLTGLANRSVMQEELQRAVEPADAPGRVAVLAIDLDEFKLINDRYGHQAGDEVLVHVAGVLRAATAGRGTVARIGGDEFCIVVQDGDAARAAFEVAAGIHKALQNPVRTHRRQLPVRASIGVAVAEPTMLATGAVGILAAADAALYRAKGGGRSRTEVYDSSMTAAPGSKHGAVAELVQAMERGEMVLHYQPTVDLSTGHVVGHEALVRWQHPERGLLLPGAFLATAAEAGLAVKLGTNVVHQAAAFLARTAATGQWVSVNVSVEQLGDGELVSQILTAISRNQITAGRLVVELTEAGIAESGSRVRGELADLRAAGIPVLLDDFGTGIAPLSYLRDMSIDGVKLDMSFTAGIPEDPAAARVSRALGALAREMDLMTIAEGIETAEQAQFLRDVGWRYGQGWLFGAGESERVSTEADGG
jgi:diguanylate cyclase (GGDEF)-like protein/PAS domain S-box-containing protein